MKLESDDGVDGQDDDHGGDEIATSDEIASNDVDVDDAVGGFDDEEDVSFAGNAI